MQVKNPEASGAKATTAASRRLATHNLDLLNHCDICGEPRSTRKHQRCSALRKQRDASGWEAYMANVAAKRQLQDRRYDRLPQVTP